MLTIGSIVLNVSDVPKASRFWAEALGYAAHPDNPAFLAPKNGVGPDVHLDDEDVTHLDLWARDKAEQLAEVERLVSLGAKRVDWDYPDGADFIVLADTGGNLFCVIDAEG